MCGGPVERFTEHLVLRYDLMFDDATGQLKRPRFVLYVEGPSDRDIVRIWARSLSQHLARGIDECVVILGGRQPARAVEHMRRLGGSDAGVRGLCVLDRDDHDAQRNDSLASPGLELFVWPRRHIESYLLVPAAILRCGLISPDDSHATRLLQKHLPGESDEAAIADIDAKRLLGIRGPLASALGASISPALIARNMRADELHPDVRALLDRVRAGLVEAASGQSQPTS